MQTQNPFLDEFSKLTNAALGLAQTAGEEAKTAFRAQADKLAAEFDLIRRDEFEALKAELPEARMVMIVAQDHHRCVVRAIENREGARAEAIMREHARLAIRNLEFALRNQRTRHMVPGSVLIKGRSGAAAMM